MSQTTHVALTLGPIERRTLDYGLLRLRSVLDDSASDAAVSNLVALPYYLVQSEACTRLLDQLEDLPAMRRLALTRRGFSIVRTTLSYIDHASVPEDVRGSSAALARVIEAAHAVLVRRRHGAVRGGRAGAGESEFAFDEIPVCDPGSPEAPPMEMLPVRERPSQQHVEARGPARTAVRAGSRLGP